jgi:hypothetical protein
VHAQVDQLIPGIFEGVESSFDVLFGVLEDFLEIACPLGQDAQNRGVLGYKLLIGDLLATVGLY